MNISFVDLKVQYSQIRDEVHAALDEVMESTNFILGEKVERFESAFANHHSAGHCVAVSSGTSALHVALLAMGIKPGDEVIVPVNTFIATAAAVSHCGATPVFVDSCEADYCIDPEGIEAAITPRSKAIIAVHLYGQPAEMETVLAVAAKHRLKVLEDCAQAHDAEYQGRKVGTLGCAGTFSFYPGKNLGAYGEGGAVITNDPDIADKIRVLRDHGSRKKYHHECVGYNYRMHGLQGAVLGVKLKYLAGWTERRRQIAARYSELLSGLPVQIKAPKSHVRHAYHLCVVHVKDRDDVLRALEGNGIACGIHYPIPLHLTRAYEHLGYRKGDFPVSEGHATEILSLPIYPEMTDEMVGYVCTALASALKGL